MTKIIVNHLLYIIPLISCLSCTSAVQHQEIKSVELQLEQAMITDIAGVKMNVKVAKVAFDYGKLAPNRQPHFKIQEISNLKLYVEDSARSGKFLQLNETEFLPLINYRIARQDFQRRIHQGIPESCRFNYIREIEEKYFSGLLSFDALTQNTTAMCGKQINAVFDEKFTNRYQSAHLLPDTHGSFVGSPSFFESCLRNGYIVRNEKVPLETIYFAIDNQYSTDFKMKVEVTIDSVVYSATFTRLK